MSYPPVELSNLTDREVLLLTCQRVQELHTVQSTVLARVEDLEREKWFHRGIAGMIAFLAGIFGPKVWDFFTSSKGH